MNYVTKIFKREKLTFTLVLTLVIAGGVFCILSGKNNEVSNGVKDRVTDRQCLIKVEERIVRGNSLAPLIKPGEKVKALFGYYHCHKIEREDIILYSYPGNNVPLIKVVKGIPEDSFELEKIDNKGWYILINGNVLKNSEGIPYLISGNRYKMLALYQRDYQGRIPEGAYLLLGNLPSGSTDSTCFGLVGKQGILAKVVFHPKGGKKKVKRARNRQHTPL